MQYQALAVRECRNTAEIYATYRAAQKRLHVAPAGMSTPFIQPNRLSPPRPSAFASVVTLQEVTVPKIPAQKILEVVANAHGISVGDMKGPRRWITFVNARHHAVSTLMRLRPDLSLPLIGKLINRDHTTVINARSRWPRIAGQFIRQEKTIMSDLGNPLAVDSAHKS